EDCEWLWGLDRMLIEYDACPQFEDVGDGLCWSVDEELLAQQSMCNDITKLLSDVQHDESAMLANTGYFCVGCSESNPSCVGLLLRVDSKGRVRVDTNW
ncbi:MAG: hypothetical protein IKE22_01050, partial [Atopobiaceae bacterium]|nr:hypothetical protein [Atopobiaceae bacterium]